MVIRVNKTFGHISYMDSTQHHILVFLGLFYLVVTTDMFFFTFETKTGDRKGAFGVIRGDLGTFWSDFRMQNHNVLCYRRFVRLVNV